MKTSRRSTARRKAIWQARVARMNEARERKRIERMADEPQREEWRGRLEWTITLHNRMADKLTTLDVRRSRRRDSYDIDANGQPWKQGMSATRLAAALRKLLARHITT